MMENIWISCYYPSVLDLRSVQAVSMDASAPGQSGKYIYSTAVLMYWATCMFRDPPHVICIAHSVFIALDFGVGTDDHWN